jgi:3-oxoadipate enol-lactonase
VRARRLRLARVRPLRRGRGAPIATLTAADGAVLHYLDEGDSGAEAVVLVGGLGDDVSVWERQLPALHALGLRVIRPDNRGAGRSECPPGPYTSRQLAGDVKAIADALKLRDFHLVGDSMGGLIAQEYALAHGDDLRTLVLASTFAAARGVLAHKLALWHDLAALGDAGYALALRDGWLTGFSPDYVEALGDDFEQLVGQAIEAAPPREGYLAQLQACLGHDARARLAGITVPTLVLPAEHDALIGEQCAWELVRAIPGCTNAVAPGGHAALWEHPDTFNALLVGFLLSHQREEMVK